jgi:glutamate racemase
VSVQGGDPILLARVGPGSSAATRLGIVDWGIGGMGFYVRFKARYPGVAVTYLSDTGVAPYGRQSARELRARFALLAERFAAAGVPRLVVACNAMSSVLPAAASGTAPLEAVTGVVAAGVEAVLDSGAAYVAVIGGVRTVRSGVYRRPLVARGVRVTQRVAQPLSALIESGDCGSPEFRRQAARVVRPMAGVDALVLGCTHYAAAAGTLGELGGATAIIDPAAETLERVVSGWFDRQGTHGRGLSEPDDGHFESRSPVADVFFTTGDPRAMARAARIAFAVTLPPPTRVDVELPKLD